MAEQPGQIGKWTLRVVVYGGAAAGIALVVAAIVSEDAPTWWLIAGVLLMLVCGTLAAIWISFRLRHRTPEQREAVFEQMRAKRQDMEKPLVRSKVAYRATRHKKAVLRSGIDGAALVTFVADGHRANEFRHLVYLELDVTVPGRDTYPVQTGEFLTPASAGSVAPGRTLHVKVDPGDLSRVAVDWEKSLRLS
jgi:hypothetical protein